MPTILIVEDEAVLAKDLSRTLSLFDYEVMGPVSTGEEALKIVRECRPNLVLLDITLRGHLDGIETASRIRSRFDIPVVFLTAFTERDVFERAKQTQPYGYLSKPVGYPELRSTIDTALHKHEADRKVRESEAKYRALVERIPAVTYSAALDEASTTLFVSPQIETLLGLSEDDYAADSDMWRKRLHPDDRQRVMAELSASRQSGSDFFSEYRMIAKDGTVVWFRDEANVVKDDHGRPLFLQGVMLDITHQKQTEEAFVENLTMVESILEKAADGICVCHNIDKAPFVKFTHWNPRMTEITGYTVDEINQLGWYQTVYPDPATRERAIDRMSRMRGGDDIVSEEWIITSKEGRSIPVSISTSVLKEAGGQVHVLAIVQAISVRKEAENLLRESEDRFRTLSEATFEAIFLSDRGICTGQNLTAEKMFGYTTQEAIGRSGTEWIAPEYRDLVQKNMLSGHEDPYEAVALRKNGTTFPCEIQGKTLDYEGKTIRVTALRDISQRKIAEEASRLNEKRFRELVELLPQPVFEMDTGARITFVGFRGFELFGYSREDLDKGIWAPQLLVESDRDRAVENLRLVFAGEQLHPQEYTALRKDGTTFPIVIYSAPILEGDAIIGARGIAVDITERKEVEERWRSSVEEYRHLVAHAGQGILIAQDGKIKFVNPMCLKYTGLQEDQLLEMPFLDLVHPEDAALVKEKHLSRMGGDSSPYRYEFRLNLPDGQTRWMEINSAQVRRAGGPAALCFLTDITDRRLAEESLRESEIKFRSTFDQAAVGVCQVAPDGRFLRVNRKICDIFGYDPEDFLGLTFQEITYPDDLGDDLDYVGRVLAGDIDTYSMEKRYIRKDGSHFWANLTVSLTRDDSGAPDYFISVIEDITDRKNFERALEAEKEFTENVLNAQRDTFFLFEPATGRDVRWNRAFRELTGYSDDEIAQLPVPNAYYSQKDLKRAKDFIRQVGKAGGGTIELELVCKDGRRIPTEYSVVSFNDGSDSPTYLISVGRDLSERKAAEATLRRLENLYRNVIENIEEVFYRSDKQGRLLMGSPSGARLFGYDHVEEMIGLPLASFWVKPQERERLVEEIKKYGSVKDFEGTLKRKDGSTFVASFTTHFYRDEHGEIQGTQGIIRDVTARKEAERKVRLSEERLRLAWETTPDYFSISRLRDALMVDVNKGFTDLTGFSREEVIGKSGLDLNIWADVGDREKLVSTLSNEGQVRDFETRFRRKDGEIRAVSLSAGLMSLGGEPHLLAIVKDIEDANQARAALIEKTQFIGSLLRAVPIPVFYKDREGRYIGCNDAFSNFMGIGSDEIHGKTVFELWPSELAEKYHQMDLELMEKGEHQEYEFQVKSKDGRMHPVIFAKDVYLDNSGEPAGLVGAFLDITEIKIAEAEREQLQKQLLQSQKMEAIGTLAGGIAHDFNNLLQAILGYADLLLKRQDVPESDRKGLHVIRNAAKDGADLVSRILTFSRRSEAKIRPLDLNSEIRKSEQLIRRTVPRMVRIDLVLEEDLKVVEADPREIEQVLLNLAINAQHAMPQGGQLLIETRNVSLSDAYLRAHLEATHTQYVLLIVSDTGIGIASEVLDRIFEPFFTTKTNGEGTGLGLSMVHGIVSRLGGFIRVYSEVGKGTSFKIFFPVSTSEPAQDPATTREMPAYGSETVLLVDAHLRQ